MPSPSDGDSAPPGRRGPRAQQWTFVSLSRLGLRSWSQPQGWLQFSGYCRNTGRESGLPGARFPFPSRFLRLWIV